MKTCSRCNKKRKMFLSYTRHNVWNDTIILNLCSNCSKYILKMCCLNDLILTGTTTLCKETSEALKENERL